MKSAVLSLVFCTAAAAAAPAAAQLASPATSDLLRLREALLGNTPLADDLRQLTDGIGGRPSGSAANRRAVQWALERLRAAGVEARAESFETPRLWLAESARATIGGGATFVARVEAMPFSAATPPGGLTAAVLDGGAGGEADFARLGAKAKGAFVLVETPLLTNLEGLFKEYEEAGHTERRAEAAGVAGVVYQGSRPRGLLYRHNASRGFKNTRPMMVMDRDAAGRVLRLLRAGSALTLKAEIAVQPPDPALQNVVAEIRGREKPEEVVLLGAHLDSWDLGTGALDNGCNVVMLMDVARQIQALGLKPRRTLRFVLWNGEEQGLLGSWAYVRQHQAELDRHVMAASFDIGSGRINGFYTNGRGAEMKQVLEGALAAVPDLGPFTQADEPVVGTDNFDFMVEGVANLIASQEDATYGPDYHASSDTFDKVDLAQVRRNAVVAAAVLWGYSESDAAWGRQDAAQVEKLVQGTSLKDQMVSFGTWDDWAAGTRGRRTRPLR
jgi:carboxypeptidase Q